MSIARKQSMKIHLTAPIFMLVTTGFIVIKDDIPDKAWNMSIL